MKPRNRTNACSHAMLRLTHLILFILATASTYAAQDDGVQPWQVKSEHVKQHELPDYSNCVLSGKVEVVCYSKSHISFVILSKASGAATQMHEYPVEKLLFHDDVSNSSRKLRIRDIWRINARRSLEGETYVVWVTEYEDMSSTVDMLIINGTEVRHVALKHYPSFKSASDLVVIPTSSRYAQVFYTDYMEEHFNILDRGDKQKIGAIKVSDGHVVYDKKISERGRYHQLGYKVGKINENELTLAWIEIRDDLFGIFLMNKRELVVARLDLSPDDSPRIVQIDRSPIKFEDIPSVFLRATQKGGAQGGVALYEYSASGKVLRLYNINASDTGQQLDLGSEMIDVSCADDTALCRGFDKNTKGGWDVGLNNGKDVVVTWFDMQNQQYRKVFDLPDRADYVNIENNNLDIDCYYWLQRVGKDFEIGSVCRD